MERDAGSAHPADVGDQRHLFGDRGRRAAGGWTAKLLGFAALIMASVNIFGGFLVTQRMLAMYQKKKK